LLERCGRTSVIPTHWLTPLRAAARARRTKALSENYRRSALFASSRRQRKAPMNDPRRDTVLACQFG
jgi:hypothetical protein